MESPIDPELAAIRARKLEALRRGTLELAGTPVVVEDSSFADFVQRHPTVVVDCWAPWCAPCRAMAPIIDELAVRWAGKVAFGKLNTDENRQTAMRYGITSIPTLLIFKGGELADQVVGLPPRAKLIEMLSPLAA